MEKLDHQAKEKHSHRWMFILFLLGLLVGIPLFEFFFTEYLGTHTRYWGGGTRPTVTDHYEVDLFGFAIVCGGAGALIGRFIAARAFRPSFGAWTRRLEAVTDVEDAPSKTWIEHACEASARGLRNFLNLRK